jgi:4-aminobutyrate aminotransferase/(S)-3-amino-2-methylpropionate transaminase
MMAIEIVRPGTTEADIDATQAIIKSCHAEGVLVLTAGTYGNVVRFLPPLVMPEDLLDEALNVIEKAVAQAA